MNPITSRRSINPNDGAGQPVTVFMGNGDGTFKSGVNYPGLPYQYPEAMVAGDFNGDGKPDIAILFWVGVGVLFGNGDGSLQPVRLSGFTGEVPWSPALVGDFNGDGKLDIAYRGYVDNTFSIITGNGDGTFQLIVSTFFTDDAGGELLSADFNGDGRLDIAVVNGGTFNASGSGTGTMNVFLGNVFSGLNIAMSHVGNLTAGKNKLYQITITNPLFAATAGMVTVVAGLPAGLSASVMTGDGWNCTLATLTCTRSDALPTGISYPNILLTAAAAANLGPSTVVPGASVTYASVTNPASDATLIVSGTTTSVTVSPNPATLGQAVTVTATVSGGATGSVLFLDGTNLLGTAALTGNQAVLNTRLIPAGARKILATYVGDSTHGLSTSSPVALTITPSPAAGFIAGPTLVTGSAPGVIQTSDLNGDGEADLVTVNQDDNSISVLLGNGNGTFQTKVDYAVGSGPKDAVIADFNRDGHPDIAVANSASQTVSVLLNNGDGTFAAGASIGAYYPFQIAVADFDSDGNPDLALFGINPTVDILYGNGDGTFRTVPGSTGICCNIGLLAADFNSDGQADLLTGATVHLNSGERTFQPGGLYTEVGSQGWYAADLNGDGKPDLVSTSVYANAVGVLLGNGDGTFQSAVNYSAGSNPTAVTVADVNGDGKLDVIAANPGDGSVSVLLGNGDGTLQNARAYPAGNGPQSIVVGDFNDDGRTDLAIANINSNTVTVLLGAALTPTLAISKTHAADFSQGQTGATYTLTVSNAGPADSSGTVTVNETVPFGLTLVSMAGTGWSCMTLPSCTRTDVLAANASYPPITVSVNVSSSAAASLTNVATIIGGGDISLSNHSASDVTTIIPRTPDLTITKTHVGNFRIGQKNAIYTITATNVGTAATDEIVTVIENIPSGLRLTAMSGGGWSCGFSFCTRSDSLAPGGSYPAITVKVNIVGNAPASVTNNATVSGGGELNSSNDSANDPTTILSAVPSKVGIFRPASFMMVAQDVNGNIAWDQNIDRAAFFGTTGDTIIYGDWDGTGSTKVGIFRSSVGMFALDMNGNGAWDPGIDTFGFFGQNGDLPIVGDWNGDGRTKVGIYRPTTGLFAIDYNGNLAYDAGTDKAHAFGLVGDTPIIGDWTGDGKAKIGVFRNGLWILDSNNNLTLDAGDAQGAIGQAGDVPLLGDWNGDGRTKVGIYRSSAGMFAEDYNGNLLWENGVDRAGVFGAPGSTPVVGDWTGTGVTRVGVFYGNGYWGLDINGNLVWDGGVQWGGFGAATGDTPVVGKWQ